MSKAAGAARNKQKNIDMTVGSPFRKIVLFTIPIILGNIFQQLYNIGDAKVVSYYLEQNAFASVGMTAVVSNMAINLLNGFTQGFGIITANAFGARDERRIRRNIAGASVLTVVLAAVLTTVSLLLISQILVWLKTPDEMMDYSLRYVRIILIGIPFSALYNLSANLLRSLGDSRTPLYCLLGSIALNLGLDFLFIGGIGMGIEGAAIATVLSQAVCGIVCFLYGVIHFRKYVPRKEDWRLERSEYGDLFLTGLSMGLMGCIVNIGTIILQTGINGLGEDIVAAQTAGRRLLDILMSLIYTYGFTMTTFTSQNMGAGKPERVRLGVRAAVLIVTVTSAVIILFSFLFADAIVKWIASTDSEYIRDNAAMYVKTGVCFFPALGPLFILRCTLQGKGQRAVPLASSVLELSVKILSVVLLVPWLGYFGVALTEPISWVLMTTLLTIGYVYSIRKEAGRGK